MAISKPGREASPDTDLQHLDLRLQASRIVRTSGCCSSPWSMPFHYGARTKTMISKYQWLSLSYLPRFHALEGYRKVVLQVKELKLKFYNTYELWENGEKARNLEQRSFLEILRSYYGASTGARYCSVLGLVIFQFT